MLYDLSHPNVVGYVDSFPNKAKDGQEHICIVTEYCEGTRRTPGLRRPPP